MAAALLARRNQPQWGVARLYMRNSYPNLNRMKRPLPNPNPNPSSVNASTDLPPPAQSEPPPATISLSSFLDQWGTATSTATIDISNCSIKELRDLKRLLLADLALVRAALHRVVSKEIRPSSRSSGLGTSHRKKQSTPNTRRNKQLASASASDMLLSDIMRKCKLILTKLMRRNSSSWFNQPVDAVVMKLPDYPSIVKNPMDLGTVKSNLHGGHYASPLEFAADVRLTFANARLYNPEGHFVNTFASQLLELFETEFGPVYDRYEKHLAAFVREEEESQKFLAQSQPDVAVASGPALSPAVPPRRARRMKFSQRKKHPRFVRPKMLPKPEANDMNKRPMRKDEERKLASDLLILPEEKKGEVLEILKRRNAESVQNGDGGFELDFEAMDRETIWELDRFVESEMSKTKVRTMEDLLSKPDPKLQEAAEVSDKSPVRAETDSDTADELIAAVDHGEEAEDVEIGEELPLENYPSVEVDKNSSGSSSSSGSDSSSSSDSDSGSSSGSDSGDSGSSSGSDSGEDSSTPALPL